LFIEFIYFKKINGCGCLVARRQDGSFDIYNNPSGLWSFYGINANSKIFCLFDSTVILDNFIQTCYGKQCIFVLSPGYFSRTTPIPRSHNFDNTEIIISPYTNFEIFHFGKVVHLKQNVVISKKIKNLDIQILDAVYGNTWKNIALKYFVGNVPRYLFGDVELVSSEVFRLFTKLDVKMFSELSAEDPLNYNPHLIVSHHLMQIMKLQPGKVCFVLPQVVDDVFRNVHIECEREMILRQFLKLRGSDYSPQLCGLYLEQLIINNLRNTFLKCSVRELDSLTQHKAFGNNFEFPQFKKVIYIPFEKYKANDFDMIRSFETDVAYLPISPTNPTFDMMFFQEDKEEEKTILYSIQITISDNHKVSLVGIDILKKLAARYMCINNGTNLNSDIKNKKVTTTNNNSNNKIPIIHAFLVPEVMAFRNFKLSNNHMTDLNKDSIQSIVLLFQNKNDNNNNK
jgi:hypothetical protein